jgi:hypothetical protein
MSGEMGGSRSVHQRAKVSGALSAHPSLPNFLIIGAAKSGTTSLYKYLKQHPDIYMSPIKEPSYFIADEGEGLHSIGPNGQPIGGGRITNLTTYQTLFSEATREKARGEASPKYLYFPEAAQRIKSKLPDVTIIAILRHPVERAYSNFLHHVRDGREVYEDFAVALQEEPKRIKEGWGSEYHYRNRGFYYKQLLPYYAAFGSEAVHVFLYDDLRKDAVGVMRDIFRILGVDQAFVPDVKAQYNVSGVPKNHFLHRVYHFLRGSNRSVIKELGKRVLPESTREKLKNNVTQSLYKKNFIKPQLPPEVRKELQQGYREDILQLQDLIQRDLSRWL